MYLLINKGSLHWLNNKVSIRSSISLALQIPMNIDYLFQGEFSEGVVRISLDPSKKYCAIWNIDYTSSVSESLFLIDFSPETGLTAIPSLFEDAFARSFAVAEMRMDLLKLSETYINRPIVGHYVNDPALSGIQSCVVGSERQHRICYGECDFFDELNSRKCVVVTGPSRDNMVGIAQTCKTMLGQIDLVRNVYMELTSPERKNPILSNDTFSDLRICIATESGKNAEECVPTHYSATKPQLTKERFANVDKDFDYWIRKESPLNQRQRSILSSDVPLSQPLRILGPAGSGKTLLMQLLAISHLRKAHEKSQPIRILYVVHNSAMALNVQDKMKVLEPELHNYSQSGQTIRVTTLLDFMREQADFKLEETIDKDAYESKAYQYEVVKRSISKALENDQITEGTPFKGMDIESPKGRLICNLLMLEIGCAIKGNGLNDKRRQYVNSELAYSRLHSSLTEKGRNFCFKVFEIYNSEIIEFEVYDSDDVAIQMLGHLRLPKWLQNRRKKDGYDLVFVDEAQLFNENERRVFQFLSKGNTANVPIALALDQAQEIYGIPTAGLATLGLTDVSNEQLCEVHRSPKTILDLAFFFLQQTTDLFGNDFPDFTQCSNSSVSGNGDIPILSQLQPNKSLTDYIIDSVKKNRKSGIRSTAVVCFSENYWGILERRFPELSNSYVLHCRGEKVSNTEGAAVLARAQTIGGQEFDAVILVGLENGVYPPISDSSDPFSITMEQQALRELYLTVTRARRKVEFVVTANSMPNSVIQKAICGKLIKQN